MSGQFRENWKRLTGQIPPSQNAEDDADITRLADVSSGGSASVSGHLTDILSVRGTNTPGSGTSLLISAGQGIPFTVPMIGTFHSAGGTLVIGAGNASGGGRDGGHYFTSAGGGEPGGTWRARGGGGSGSGSSGGPVEMIGGGAFQGLPGRALVKGGDNAFGGGGNADVEGGKQAAFGGDGDVNLGIVDTESVNVAASGNNLGFHGETAIGRQTITGATGGNVALQNILAALAAVGLIIDNTT